MFNWITSIATSVKGLFIGIAITLGIVSAPQIPAPMPEAPQEIIQTATSSPTVTPTPIPTPTPTLTSTKTIEKKDTPSAPGAVQTFIQSIINPSTTQTPTPTPTLKPNLTPTPTPIPTSTPTQTSVTPTSEAPIITSVNIDPTRTSAEFEWQTDKPTQSKIFISGSSLSSKVFNSSSDLSTRHLATVTGLAAGATYTYEIEAIASDSTVVKKQGGFDTLAPPPPSKFISGPTPIITKSDNGEYKLTTIEWMSDKPAQIDWILPKVDYQKCFPLTNNQFKPRTTYTCTVTLTDTETSISSEKTFSFTTGVGIFIVEGFNLASDSSLASPDPNTFDFRFTIFNYDIIPITLQKIVFPIEIQGGGGSQGNFTIGNLSKTKMYRYLDNWQNTGDKVLVLESDTSFDGSALTINSNIIVSPIGQKAETYYVSVSGLTGNPGPSDSLFIKMSTVQIQEDVPVEFNSLNSFEWKVHSNFISN